MLPADVCGPVGLCRCHRKRFYCWPGAQLKVSFTWSIWALQLRINHPTLTCPLNWSQPVPACPGVDFGSDLPMFGSVRNGHTLHPTRQPRALRTCDSQSSKRMDLSFTCSSISCVQIFSLELSKMSFRMASSTVTMDSLLSMMKVAKC